ncbi:MAG: glycerol kinase GlpK [Firmicutes bacterium]|nr:glycerol kinase GlpK [Bacillota bacterium]
MGKYILALDQGTTSSRAILFDRQQNIIDISQKEFPQIYPHEGWVEHDPMEIYASQYSVITEIIARSGIRAEDIHAIGITNQRETTVVWDKNTGEPVYNAIVWQCRRTSDYCTELMRQGRDKLIHQKTGLLLDAYFSATKIRWILENVDGARERAERGELLFGTVDTWILWKLTGGKVHATDYTNASRTMLFNINTLQWDDELLELFGIPKCMLPEVRASGEIYGCAEIFGAEIPIGGIAGDQQAALFGQACFNAGESKNTYGTGCFMLMNTGSTPIFSTHGLVTTIAATCRGEQPNYALEGSVFVGGAVIQWLRDSMKLITDAPDSEYFAQKVKDNGGVYIVPAFVGLGAPHWDTYARGTIVGVTRGSGRNHLIRAALESIAYQTNDVLNAMGEELGAPLSVLKTDGGASANNFLMQFQADISEVEVDRPKIVETTALGAAFLAGLSTGFWQSRDEIVSGWKPDRKFTPNMAGECRRKLLNGWNRAVKTAHAWSKLEQEISTED